MDDLGQVLRELLALLKEKELSLQPDASPLETYTYSRLPSNDCIRLLKLEQFRILRYGRQPMIACDLITVKLDDAPDYTALSYSWGKQNRTVPIRRGKKSLLVTRSLGEALQVIRSGWSQPAM